MKLNQSMADSPLAHALVAHALLRAATALMPSQGIRKMRSHECERGTQECVRHARRSVRHNFL
jgi:hypothetical protein